MAALRWAVGVRVNIGRARVRVAVYLGVLLGLHHSDAELLSLVGGHVGAVGVGEVAYVEGLDVAEVHEGGDVHIVQLGEPRGVLFGAPYRLPSAGMDLGIGHEETVET